MPPQRLDDLGDGDLVSVAGRLQLIQDFAQSVRLRHAALPCLARKRARTAAVAWAPAQPLLGLASAAACWAP